MQHVYKIGPALQWLLSLSVFVLFFVFNNRSSGINPYYAAIACLAAYPLLALLLAWLVGTLSLTENMIERKTPFFSRRLAYTNISHWGVIKHYGKSPTYSLKIHSKDGEKSLEISYWIKVDAYFKSWIETYPNRTEPQARISLDRFKNLPPEEQPELAKVMDRFGASPEVLTEKFFAQSGLKS